MAQLIVVGCKLPHGLIIRHKGKEAVLKGANASSLIGGYGITQVDKEFFDAWSEAHKDYAPLKRGVIFSADRAANAESVAKERGDLKTGMEGLNPDKPMPKVVKADSEEA